MGRYPIPPVRTGNPPGRQPGAAASFWVLYDADCGLCSKCVAFLAKQRSSVPFRWAPVGSDEARELAPDRPVDEMGAFGPGGEVWFGGDAWIVCLWNLPRYRWLAGVMAWAAVRPLVHFGYGLVARNRQHISRWLGGSCRIP